MRAISSHRANCSSRVSPSWDLALRVTSVACSWITTRSYGEGSRPVRGLELADQLGGLRGDLRPPRREQVHQLPVDADDLAGLAVRAGLDPHTEAQGRARDVAGRPARQSVGERTGQASPGRLPTATRAPRRSVARRAGACTSAIHHSPSAGACPVEPVDRSIASPATGDDFDLGDGDPSVQRRNFLRAGSSLAISGLLAAVIGDGAGSSSATPDVVDELTHRLVSLRKLDETLGGADTYRLYAAEAELTGHLLQGGAHRDVVHRGPPSQR